ncbi:hypothetical protein PgNI_06630, partial [Pyricularia grisea]|uniref:Carrier domain-containing protein n=1 Tax=Pyricularia grisea TaxID=148305 RepID=A0A6P8B3Y2_PYRGI
VLDQLAPFTNGHEIYRGIKRCTVVGESDEELKPWKELTSKAQTLFDFRTAFPTEGPEAIPVKFDLIITGNDKVDLETLKPMLNEGGRLVAWDQQVPEKSITIPEGFEGTELLLDEQHITIATLRRAVDTTTPVAVSLLVSDNVNADTTQGTEALLRAKLQGRGIETRMVHLKDAINFASQPIISLLDMGKDVINSWTAEQFEYIRQLMAMASHIFWVTQSGLGCEPSEDGLKSAGIAGFLRVMRNEYPNVKLAHLDLSPAFDFAASAPTKLVIDTWLRSVNSDAELELAERDGHLLLPRVVAAPGVDQEVALSIGTAPAIPTALAHHASLEPHEGAGGKRLVWTRDTEVGGPLGSEDVEIRVSHLSVDCGRLGHGTKLLGSFITGCVTRTGPSVSGLSCGDMVIAVGGRDRRTLIRRPWATVLPLPHKLDVEFAAIQVWLHITARYIINHISRVARHEALLIQDGATGLGQALIHTAQRAGAEIFVTVDTFAQQADLMQRFGLPSSSVVVMGAHITSLDAYLQSKVGRKGLHVVVASAAGTPLVRLLSSTLSDFARVAIIGPQDTSGTRLAIRANIQITAVDPTQLLHKRPTLVARLLAEVSGVFAEGEVPAILPQTRFSVANLPQALAWLQKPDSAGIASVHFDNDAQVPVVPAPPPRLQLNSEATYVLVGGLGSLGMRIADLLADHGAKHVSFLSRSGDRTRCAQQLAALEARGCGVAIFACDVVSVHAVKDTIAELGKLGRPVKGLVQCAMVLQDSIFAKMTHAQWTAAFAPKVAGTWNLHKELPADMDFFVMLSSVVSIIGNMAQANYAAGNAYMDALARFRRAQGLPAVSINAGLVRDSGHSVDGSNMTEYLDRFRHIISVSTDLDELSLAVIAAMRGTTADGSLTPPQFVFTMSDSLDPTVNDTWAIDRKFVHRLAISGNAAGTDSVAGPGVAETLAAASSLDEATVVVSDSLKMLLAPGLNMQPSDVSDESPLYNIGVDSFKAVEVRNRVVRELESDISVFELLSSNTLAQTSRIIASRSRLVPGAARTDGGDETEGVN